MNTLLFIHIVVAILLVTTILLQSTGADGLSGLGGSNTSLVSRASASSFLSRTTIILGIAFFTTSIILANLSINSSSSVLDKVKNTEKSTQEEAKVPNIQ